jgi:hypothetical protein
MGNKMKEDFSHGDKKRRDDSFFGNSYKNNGKYLTVLTYLLVRALTVSRNWRYFGSGITSKKFYSSMAAGSPDPLQR